MRRRRPRRRPAWACWWEMAWTRLGLGEGRHGPSPGALLEGEPTDLPVDRMCGQKWGHQGTPTVTVRVAGRGAVVLFLVIESMAS